MLDEQSLPLIERHPVNLCFLGSGTMQVAPIFTEADYRQALNEIRRLVAAEPDLGTPDGEWVEALTSAAEVFEAGHHLLDLADIAAR